MCAGMDSMKTFKELAEPKPSFVREHIRKVLTSIGLEAHPTQTSGADEETPGQ